MTVIFPSGEFLELMKIRQIKEIRRRKYSCNKKFPHFFLRRTTTEPFAKDCCH